MTKKKSILLALLCCAGLGSGAFARDSKPVDVPPGDLTTAIKLFVKQSGVELVYRPEQLKGLKTKGVQGTLSIQEAVNKLLEGTSLTLRTDSSGVLWIASPETRTSSGALANQMRATSMGNESATRPAAATADAADETSMVVEAERDRERALPFSTANIDLMRTEDDVLPFTVFTAKDIQQSGAANVEEFLRNKLPQNFSATIPEERDGGSRSSGSGGADVSLRGWGSAEVVVLLNGRRMAGRNLSGSDTASSMVNFRNIPTGSIERIEVLTSSGSAIYGENATGGIINIITRRAYRGGFASVSMESPADVGAPKINSSFSYALPLRSGLSARVEAGMSRVEPLRVGDRANVMADRWRALALQRAPQLVTGAAAFPSMGETTNIRAVTQGAPLFGAGTPSFTSVPAGYTGGQGLTPFLGRQGVYNLTLDEGAVDGMYSRNATLGKAGETRNFQLGLEQALGAQFSLALEYSYSASSRDGNASHMEFSSLTVPGAAPVNPFGVDVWVVFDDPRMNRPELRSGGVSNTTDQWVATLRGRHGRWHTLADFSAIRSRDEWTYGAFAAPVGGWSAALLSGRYNPFVDMRVAAPAAASFYEEYVAVDNLYHSNTRTTQATLKASGPVYDLPAGEVTLTAGAERSTMERYRADWNLRYANTRTGVEVPLMAGDPSRSFAASNSPARLYDVETHAAYAEVNVPLLSGKQGFAWAHRLELFGSGRISSQDRNGFSSAGVPISYSSESTLVAAGFRYDFFEGLMLRASRSVGFKPALLTSGIVAANPPTNSINVTDRVRNLPITLLPSQYITGGNPDLKPETTTSTNYGLVYEPRWSDKVRVSLNYLENVRDDAITSLSLQTVLDLESDPTLGARVQRDASGVITFVDSRTINLNQTVSRSADLNLEYWREQVGGGRLMFVGRATRNLGFKVQTTATSAPVEQVRNPLGAFAQQLKWNANAQVLWERAQWTYGWSTRFYDTVLARPTDQALQGSDRAEAELEHDAFATYRFPELGEARGISAVFTGAVVNFGVKNVFDRAPRFWAASTGYGYVTYDSIQGRSLWAQLSKSF